jgi:hypothetical protein
VRRLKRLKIFFHDNCFDGAASAALFAEFYRWQVARPADIILQGVQHGPGDPFAGLAFDGDDNACVDFRYSPEFSWWFDHHLSAFQPPTLRADFEADTTGQKFYDPTARSCTKFLASILRERFGFDPPEFAELVYWADIIDGAQFPDARTAVEVNAPALELMMWLENNSNAELTHRFINELGKKNLAQLAGQDWIRAGLAPVLARHDRDIALIERSLIADGDVGYFDLLDEEVDAHNKFIPYLLLPETRYMVGLTRSAERCKISVGSNPWSDRPRSHNIAKICERYGGGGHPVVGAVSLAADQVERARQIGAEIRSLLAGNSTR